MLPKSLDFLCAMGLFLASSAGTMTLFHYLPSRANQIDTIASDLAIGQNSLSLLYHGRCVGDVSVTVEKSKGYSLMLEGRVLTAEHGLVSIIGSASFNPIGQMTKLEADIAAPNALTVVSAHDVYPIEISLELPTRSESNARSQFTFKLPLIMFLSEDEGRFRLQTQHIGEVTPPIELFTGIALKHSQRASANSRAAEACSAAALDSGSLNDLLAIIGNMLHTHTGKKVVAL